MSREERPILCQILECQQRRVSNVPLHAEFMSDKAVIWVDAVLATALVLCWNFSLTIFLGSMDQGGHSVSKDRKVWETNLKFSLLVLDLRPQVVNFIFLRRVFGDESAKFRLARKGQEFSNKTVNSYVLWDSHGFHGFLSYIIRIRELAKAVSDGEMHSIYAYYLLHDWDALQLPANLFSPSWLSSLFRPFLSSPMLCQMLVVLTQETKFRTSYFSLPARASRSLK